MQVRRCVFLVNAPVAVLASPTVAVISPKVRDSAIQKSGLWNTKYSKKKTHTQKKTHQKKFRNPTKDWNPESKFH